MPNTILGRNLYLCFPKSKSQSPSPKRETPDPGRPFFIKNFNSLYDAASEPAPPYPDSLAAAAAYDGGEPGFLSAPDLAAVQASRRFFFSSPGRSNSIVDSSSASSSRASTSFSSPTEPDAAFGSGSVAVPTISPDPFLDFRRSMQEMVEARQLTDVRANWDRLHELLMCYLTLNPKSAHKFIVGAFADLLVSLMPSPPECRRRPESSSVRR
ncbi:unnamed protein product [Cuscuta campestris]|uniref:Transcription repressor n=1 Tax=Cuscuta campestris TaxID=132261 RepID=A0A484K9T2_9ASTE|nr:unnamed protein product [Cuscuta campestris]